MYILRLKLDFIIDLFINVLTMDGVSVIICCYNSETRIIKVLEYLARQETDSSINWEIVLVDNASTDKTAEVAMSYWSGRSIPMRIVPEPEPGLSNARNAGLKEARYAFVSFIDDDNWVEEQWVNKVYKWFHNNEKIGLLGSNGEAVIDGNKPFWFDRLQMCYAVGPQDKETGIQSRVLYGAGLSIRKKTWDDLKSNGFRFILSGRSGKSITSGEDSELCLAVMLAGYNLFYDSELRFFHYMPGGRINWEYLIKLIQSFGRTDPVLNIYYSVVNKNSGFKRMISENRWMVLLSAVYQFISNWPGYFKIIFSNKEGRLEHVGFKRTQYSILEILRLFPVFPAMVSSVRNGKWRKI